MELYIFSISHQGILCALPLAYIIPPICYIRLEEGPVFARTKWKAWGVILFGSVTMLVGSITVLSNLQEHSQCSHGRQMDYCFSDENRTVAVDID